MGTPDFSRLARIDPKLAELGRLAARSISDDPSNSLVKVRRFAERITISICREKEIEGWEEMTLEEQIDELRGHVPGSVIRQLHDLRVKGNLGAHEKDDPRADDPDVARSALHGAAELGSWYSSGRRGSASMPGPLQVIIIIVGGIFALSFALAILQQLHIVR